MRRTLSTSSSRWRLLLKSGLFVITLAVLLWAVQFVVFPRHDRDELWSDYEKLPPNSLQVLFLGTSLVHANLNPAVMWRETGVRSYDLSGSEQSLLTTGPYLEEALKKQHPDVVALELHMFSRPNLPLSENQKRSNLTMMPLGLPKLRAITSATPAGEWTRYLLPIEQFHSRWNELGRADFDPRKWRKHREDLFFGYRKVDRVEPQHVSDEKMKFDQELYKANYRELSQIIRTAQRAGSSVVLFVGPSSRERLHEEWLPRLKSDVARDFPTVKILETQARTKEIGLSYARDYYDDLHLNSRGAEKYSAWLGRQLLKSLRTTKDGDQLDAPWREEFERYMKARGND